MLRLILAALAVAFAYAAGRATKRALWVMACETPDTDPEPSFIKMTLVPQSSSTGVLPPVDTYIGTLWGRILHPERSET